MNPGFDGGVSAAGGVLLLFVHRRNRPAGNGAAALLDEIARLRGEGVDGELFTLCKNQMYGEMLQDLENIEDAATALAGLFSAGARWRRRSRRCQPDQGRSG